MQLKTVGMDVATADNGSTALELMRAAARAATPFDVAVIDMKMPIMDGLTLAGELRRDPALAATRMVMLTSLASGNEAQLAYESGVDVYLTKPVRQSELLDALSRVLSREEPAVARAVTVVPGKRARVLVVEDNLVNQEVARVMLRELGCEIRLADNGREALNAMRTQTFDLVLMDCQMPEMDGFEALRRFRSATPADYETSLAVPIVALTANALAGDQDRCLAAGFNDYMAKPFKQQQLDQLLERWTMQGNRSAASARMQTPMAAEAAPPVDGGALDLTVIERIRDMERRGAARLLERLIHTYLTTAAKHVADAEQALASGDASALRHAVHTLKSSSANLGATGLSQHCATLETHARSRQIHAARRDWPAARTEYERAVQALRAMSASSDTAMTN
jgi:CheY-like chemotaxis protein/HPt (histidine-containing phosphotransfer) domain-containing protein